jgi:hypothetical protein
MSSKVAKNVKLKKPSIDDFGGIEKGKPGRPRKKKKAAVKKTTSKTVVTAAPDDPPPSGDVASNLYAALDEAAQLRSRSVSGQIPDPTELMNLAISADLDASIFTEKSFPIADNVIDWCRSPQLLGFKGELRAKQIEILARFFADVCYFCSDAEYVYNVPVDDSVGNVLDRFVFLQHGVCPKCRRNRMEILTDWMKEPLFFKHNEYEENVPLRPVPPNEFVGVWGQRSGKSFTVATFAAPYILHRYLALPSPPRYFNRADNIIFEATFVAPTLHQVTESMWMPFRSVYDNSPWFREVKDHLVEEGRRVGVPLYHAATRFILFPGKRISVHVRAASSTNLRGATRIFATLDELGWFNSTEEGKRRAGVKDGTEVFNALDNSLVTVRTQADRRRRVHQDYNSLDGYMFNISSPSSIADPIMQRAGVASRHPRMYYTHYPTWEVNPDEEETTIREQLAGNPERLQRDFCAIPPRALSPFFPNANLVRQLEAPNSEQQLSDLFNYSIDEIRDTDGRAVLRPVIQSIQPDFLGGRVLAIDNGEVDNSFALCVARFDPDLDGVVYEEFLEVAPYKGFSVDLAWCYDELILPLVGTYRFVRVVFDRWNSAQQVHDLRNNHQVQTERYTLKWSDFMTFRNCLQDMKVRFATPEVAPDELLQMRGRLRSTYPRAHFQLQLTTVEEFSRKVYKPANGTDDLFRVGALAHSDIMRHKDEYLKQSAGNTRRGPGMVSAGVFRGSSSTGRSGSGFGVQKIGASGGRSSGFYYNRSSSRRRNG